ncbi:hypothetical protein BJX62DRAFT_246582 [Aspergillus germanicus]
MPRAYTNVANGSPRSFLFAVVANVGPEGASRTLAVAYRQGSDNSSSASLTRMHHVVADTLAVIAALSEPANRAPLEAERALAEDWYHHRSQSQRDRETETENSIERPCIPDTPQPPFVHYSDRRRYKRADRQRPPELPSCDDGASSEFPFTTTCLLLGLLRETEDHNAKLKANAFRSNHNRTRPGDVQLQPLSTVFRGNCLEYGLVVLDISDLDAGVKYGIVAFPYKYMADVYYWSDVGGWDPVEDPLPEKEPDIIPTTPRPRVPLSILQWVHTYHYTGLTEDPSVLRLDAKPRVNATSLDYIPAMTTSHEPRQDADVDYAIDDLLRLIKADDAHLKKGPLDSFQKPPKLPEHLRRRLEEVPDSLRGSSVKAGAQILRIAYARCTHLKLVTFKNLTPSLIAAAIASDELHVTATLSISVDNFQLDEDEKGINELVAVLAQSTSLKQLCILQRPDRKNDDASARFCTRLLLLAHLDLLRDKTIYSTCAFSASLRGRTFTLPSKASANLTCPFTKVFPVIHMFTFESQQREDLAGTVYSHYYNMGNTLLDPEVFATRFLSYLRSAGSGSGSDKAILQFARGAGIAPSCTSTTNATTDNDDDNNNSPPPSSLSPSGRFAVGPIPAGFFGTRPTTNNYNQSRPRVRLRDIHPGSWVVLIDQQGLNSSGDFNDDDDDDDDDDDYYDKEEDDVFLRYSFIRIRQTSADIAPEDHEQQQRPYTLDLILDHSPNHNVIDVVGELSNFLHSTVPGLDTSTWEKRVSETEGDFLASARDLQKRRSYKRTKDMDIFTWEKRMIEADRRQAAGLPEIKRREPGVGVGVLDVGRVRELLGRLL